ncbi:hypothetical protein SAMN05444359_12410 [Neolewinella agarilytica]|uniref:Uncharacterized protein n=1 Tax=Neolewinella agarilytica TaxID=478744 RepID=A0A1H9LEP5_9BACT|nr:hypothetical protein SAMN05444359_12410 [Neolewinella agarilytica]
MPAGGLVVLGAELVRLLRELLPCNDWSEKV